ncbi:hypothetical protein tb265_49250 [Gemmatimonadetes bacterium T265]|nr:hypothetical protein tb265_49250 [Gemmatimonadetes bacterium T265]
MIRDPTEAGGRHEATLHAARPLLRRARVWRVLLAWSVAYGLLTWTLEAALLRKVPGAPPEPWSGAYRLAETLLWLAPITAAIAIAERWPITNVRREWRRVAAQLALGLALGPAWGALAYAISPVLMPWWHARGVWGVIAKEAKGALFGYGTTAVLAHVAVRVLAQRRRAVAAAEAVQRAAEARLDLLRLELQPDALLRTMDGIADTIPRDPAAANNALVLLADSLRGALASARVREVTLREELENVGSVVRLHAAACGTAVRFGAACDASTAEIAVPPQIVQALVEDLLPSITARHAEVDVEVRARSTATGVEVDLTFGTLGRATPMTEPPLTRERGVRNTRERLRSLYGHAGDLAYRRDEETGAAVITLRLPVVPPARAAA